DAGAAERIRRRRRVGCACAEHHPARGSSARPRRSRGPHRARPASRTGATRRWPGNPRGSAVARERACSRTPRAEHEPREEGGLHDEATPDRVELTGGPAALSGRLTAGEGSRANVATGVTRSDVGVTALATLRAIDAREHGRRRWHRRCNPRTPP